MFLPYIVVIGGKPQRQMLSPLLFQEGRCYCPSFILIFLADVEPHIGILQQLKMNIFSDLGKPRLITGESLSLYTKNSILFLRNLELDSEQYVLSEGRELVDISYWNIKDSFLN